MRAKVLRGFCIAPMVHAVPGQVVDLTDSMYKEMLLRGSVEPPDLAPEPEPEPEPEHKPASKPKSK